MLIEIPDDILQSSQAIKPEDMQLEIAVWLYERRLVTLARAARWVGLSRLRFQKALAERRVAIHYTSEDLKMDFQNA